MSWNDERVELLKKLWAEGLSASHIAHRLGGITRNSVISKVHRMKLPHRLTSKRMKQSQGGKIGAKRFQAQRRAKAGLPPKPQTALQRVFSAPPEPFEPRPTLEVPIGQRKVLDQLTERDCRFPYGDGPFTFCARPKATGLSYCEDHARICFQPPSPVRRPSGHPARSLPVVADNDSGGEGRVQTPANEIATSGFPRAKETV